MRIDFYIHKLLFTHDCVVLPGFGGFVSSYASAKIHPINHTFRPPSKSILFNSNLVVDDGLLIHHISQSENLDYQDAKAMVAEFVNSCEMELSKLKSIEFAHLGKIRRDVEGSLLFEPDTETNFLEESFGLPVFVSPAIVRQPIHKRLEKQFADRKPLVNHKSSEKRKVKLAYLAVIPVLIFSTWLYFNIGNNSNVQETGLLPLHSTEFTDVPDQSNPAGKKSELTLKTNDPVNLTPSDSSSPELIPDSEESHLVIEKPEKVIVEKKYYIIGGAFRNPANSEKKIIELRNQGYDAKSAGKSKTGLHMVCYFQTPDKLEALMNLSLIRKEDNPSAWLLRK